MGHPRPLQHYLDELLSDDERLERSAMALMAHFDATIERQQAANEA